ncbi:hypothetical protein [Dehalogenimonas etheniformans]|uniref:Uncharacterized protein n=1 Tax=Dehalogenimonas etheniformans TaxID=1536648 RepID=A0A2P5P5F8_9CHLR|nr:hypothetical protein [Dehalogenimonas etheniformans]PPD57532.1 hypothetical protein JP09_009415 [Dehalogenimonas etheniformans]QNT76893.1 hypothetical protein HX448_09505 [Dehalogenimonas etheniformans]
MRLRQYDPEKPVSYLKLVGAVLHNYGSFHHPEDLVRIMGEKRLTDVTHTPEMGEATINLYDGGDQRVFQFKESANRGGTIDVLFNHNHLESFRAQLFFEGMLGKPGALIFSSLRLGPLVSAVVGGKANISFDASSGQFFCHYGDLVISYTHEQEMGIPSISTSILCRQTCPANLFNRPEQLRFSIT